MKILLVGEYSGLHNNLKDGLVALGHEVVIAATGDGFKKIGVDISFDSEHKGWVGKFERILKPLFNVNRLTDFDVVQFINPVIFSTKLNFNALFMRYLINSNEKSFLLGAGCDAIFWQKTRKILKYGPFDDALRFDLKSISHPVYGSEKSLNWNNELISLVNGVIPIMFEYEIGYQGEENVKPCIPIPINIDKIKYSHNKVTDKLVVFHGLNRYGFKGTRVVESAFERLKLKYENKMDLVIDGKMPLQKYLDLINRTNVIIDQVFSHSCGMNALFSMAMGKCVLGGAEPESLISLNIKKTPVINITPDYLSIVEAIEGIQDNVQEIERIGYESRRFVEVNHNYLNVAQQYCNAWLSS